MRVETIYRSLRGEEIVHDLYDRALRRLQLAVEDRRVETRFGDTHVLVAGPADAPPVIVLQGGNSLAPLTLAWYRPLARGFRVYAPDTVSHPGYSAPRRPPPSDGGYGQWLIDVLDALSLERAALVGTSHGGAVALQAAAARPERVGPTALAMPAGVVSPRLSSMARLALPMLLYRAFPSEERLRRAVSPLFTDPPDGLWLETLGAVFQHVRLETRLPRSVPAEELSAWGSPAIVFAAEEDLLYGGDRLLGRAREIIPNLDEAVLLRESRHIPSETTRREMGRRVEAWLGARAAAD